MQADPNGGISEEVSNKGRIGFLISFLNDVIKISHRLVGMDDQGKQDFIQGDVPRAGVETASRFFSTTGISLLLRIE
jgi:hypothetical protein